jgi:hypothetical protein
MENEMRAWLIKEVELDPVDFEQAKIYLDMTDNDLIELVPIRVTLKTGRILTWHMAVDEEGLRKNLTINPLATGIYAGHSQIVGNALLLEGQFD